MSETILVVGGTGRLGRPVAEQLRVDGYRVRILTRDAEAAAERFGEGFEIVSGNTTDTESLESAMSGCAGVHINDSVDFPALGKQKNACRSVPERYLGSILTR